jgi:hypothetical protein
MSILEGKKRAELHESLISSSSTLLVVPNPLLKHWEEQILSHIDFKYCSKEQQHIVYYHTKKKNIQASNPALSFDLQQTLAMGGFCFIDDGSKELPPASILSRFTIVLTAYNRFTAEWKLGSLEHEKRASRTGDVYWGDDLDSEASPILKVHWLRLIVDEGHTVSIFVNESELLPLFISPNFCSLLFLLSSFSYIDGQESQQHYPILFMDHGTASVGDDRYSNTANRESNRIEELIFPLPVP